MSLLRHRRPKVLLHQLWHLPHDAVRALVVHALLLVPRVRDVLAHRLHPARHLWSNLPYPRLVPLSDAKDVLGRLEVGRGQQPAAVRSHVDPVPLHRGHAVGTGRGTWGFVLVCQPSRAHFPPRGLCQLRLGDSEALGEPFPCCKLCHRAAAGVGGAHKEDQSRRLPLVEVVLPRRVCLRHKGNRTWVVPLLFRGVWFGIRVCVSHASFLWCAAPPAASAADSSWRRDRLCRIQADEVVQAHDREAPAALKPAAPSPRHRRRASPLLLAPLASLLSQSVLGDSAPPRPSPGPVPACPQTSSQLPLNDAGVKSKLSQTKVLLPAPASIPLPQSRCP
mmetsp:Transcript_8498/g.20820  ORF Transcript_8498/g.20820 Transcript_8498/m.20820 type:complete len:335 (-) Transcript_8498:73-1077(-)